MVISHSINAPKLAVFDTKEINKKEATDSNPIQRISSAESL